MAQTLGIRIQALTNFDADNIEDDTFDSVKYNVLTNQWLNDGYKEIVNLLSFELLSPILGNSNSPKSSVISSTSTRFRNSTT